MSDVVPIAIPRTECPYCKNPIKVINAVGGRYPRPGMSTMCLKCGEIAIIEDGMRLRKAGYAELIDVLKNHPEFNELQRMVLLLHEWGVLS